MAVSTLELCRWIVIVILTLFHGTVTFFIFQMRRQKSSKYDSHFYTLYILISVADILQIINNFLSSKIFFIDPWKPWFFEHPMYFTIVWLASGYLIYLQSILHAAIAINRAWVSFSLKKGYSAWDEWGRRITWFIPVMALFIVSPRFLGSVRVYYSSSGELSGVYIETFVKTYHSTAGPSVVISTALINFFLTILIIFRYRHLFKQYKTLPSSMKQEILLFGQAIITLIFQLSIVAFYCMVFVASANALLDLQFFALQIYFPFATDASSLCNPFALLIICKFIRQDFFRFLFGSKFGGAPVASVMISISGYR